MRVSTVSQTWNSGAMSSLRACDRYAASPGRDINTRHTVEAYYLAEIVGVVRTRWRASCVTGVGRVFSKGLSLYGEGDLASSSIRISLLPTLCGDLFIELTMKV